MHARETKLTIDFKLKNILIRKRNERIKLDLFLTMLAGLAHVTRTHKRNDGTEMTNTHKTQSNHDFNCTVILLLFL